jgi:hypothetical protein
VAVHPVHLVRRKCHFLFTEEYRPTHGGIITVCIKREENAITYVQKNTVLVQEMACAEGEFPPAKSCFALIEFEF